MKKTILIFVEHGKIWGSAKVKGDGFEPVIIVQNNDDQTIERLEIEHNCKRDVENAVYLAKIKKKMHLK